ncbi:hypothetical protein [Nocardia sp. NPDC046763]|uniref:hypothetical protein n=1 Tax=Nocardia sp. NPDC046763 TaxID=3155256 RepID=UPI003410864D
MTIGTLAITLAWVPFADPEQLAMLGTVALIIMGYSGFRLCVALGYLPAGLSRTIVSEHASTGQADAARSRTLTVSRVRQQHRLVSRSWLEFTASGKTRWLPVYFDPILPTLTKSSAECSVRAVYLDGHRLYPSGRLRDSEPPGRLIDNPVRPDPDALGRDKFSRRLLLDAQSAVAAPFAALLWVYIAGGGPPAFAAAMVIAAVTATWLSAVRGSDPS